MEFELFSEAHNGGLGAFSPMHPLDHQPHLHLQYLLSPTGIDSSSVRTSRSLNQLPITRQFSQANQLDTFLPTGSPLPIPNLPFHSTANMDQAKLARMQASVRIGK